MSDQMQVHADHEPDNKHQQTDADSGGATSSRRPDRDKPRIPTIDEALGQLVQLNGAVMLKLISSKDASLIQRNLKTILDVHLRRASQQDAGVNQEALAELCQRDPQLVNLISPFLSDAQVDWLMDQVRADTDLGT